MGIGNIQNTLISNVYPVRDEVYIPVENWFFVTFQLKFGSVFNWYIHRLLLCEHHTINETVLELKKRNVHISSSEVAYLAQRFIIYLSILHQQSASLLKMHIIEKGGYILHIDGTCDGASPHLVSAIDEVKTI